MVNNCPELRFARLSVGKNKFVYGELFMQFGEFTRVIDSFLLYGTVYLLASRLNKTTYNEFMIPRCLNSLLNKNSMII